MAIDIRNELWWLAETVRLEAGGEHETGQLAVACVIVTRSHKKVFSIRETVLAPLQFSCWNGNSAPRQRDEFQWSCWQAACAAYFSLATDPSKGATHYLRTDLDPKPAWYDPSRVTATIGRHTFLRLP